MATLFGLLLVPEMSSAQEALAARLLESGDRLARDDKLDQARDTWQDVVARYPDEPAAPTALERLGTSYYPVEAFALRGQIGGAGMDAAQAFFERLARDYRTSREAPRAAFKLGLLYSDPVSPFYDLDEAYAWFSRLVTVYPDSDLVDHGLFGLGSVLVAQRGISQALMPLSQLLAEQPGSPIAAEARYLTANALADLDRFPAALRAFQSVIDEAPESELAVASRDRITHLVRLHHARQDRSYELYTRFDRIVPRLQAEYRIRTVSSLSTDPENRLVLTDSRTGLVHILDREGKPVSRTAVRRAAAAWAGEGTLLVGAESAVVESSRSHNLVVPDGRGTVTDIGFLARDTLMGLIAWDRRSGDVVRFDHRLAFDRRLVAGRDQRVDSIAAQRDGTLYILGARTRTVTVYPVIGPSRQVLISDDTYLRKPSAIAVDFVGNIFVLDAVNREVGIFERDGRLLTRISSGKTPEDPFPEPSRLAVNGRGDILIYDARHEAVVVLK